MSPSSGSDSAESVRSVSAGNFSTWLEVTLRTGDSLVDSDVPCGDCTACCTSSYFIHIQPHETSALARISPDYLVDAPGLPPGHVVMGYNELGHCPMFVDGGCSIYDDRPQTCREYDCRIFAATGVELTDKPRVLAQTRRWEFETPTNLDEVQRDAVRTCKEFLLTHSHNLPPGSVPKDSTNLAMLAISLHVLFMSGDVGAEHCVVPDIDVVVDALSESMTQTRLAR
jgi:Fe-S-cluster containining protein